jgi:hypothetical protein
MVEYGKSNLPPRKANLSSALGGKDFNCYADKRGEDYIPTVYIAGCIHGGEFEGTVAIMNLISLLETGVDLAGNKNEKLLAAAQRVHLILTPMCNPDGRSHIPFDNFVGHTFYDLRYYNQGIWKDGSLCGWPECKQVHPIKDHVEFLGGYFNDDGINLMHDNFFHPMAKETQALLDLCESEHADWILHLHGGSNSLNALLQTHYVTLECQQAIQDLAKTCDEYCLAHESDLRFTLPGLPGKETGATPPSFNLPSAAHHVCGGVSAVFESNEHISTQEGPKFSHEQIYRSHRILFEQCFLTAAKR